MKAALFLGMAAIAFPALAADPPAPAPDPAALFAKKCAVCHDARGWASVVLGRGKLEGQGVLTNRKDLPAALTRQVIRHGEGEMPGFTPTDLDDDEVAAIAVWLDKTR